MKGFHTELWVRNSDIIYVHSRVEHISQYTIDSDRKVSHCWRKNLQIRKGERHD